MERLVFESINCDGAVIQWEYYDYDELRREYWSDDCALPSNDDEIVCAYIQIWSNFTQRCHRIDIPCKTFYDLAVAIGMFEGFSLP